MPYNKIIYKNNTLIDLTGDSVSRETLARGVTAHDKAGNPIVGEANFPITLQEKSITQNGEYTPDTGYDGFSKVSVNVADIPAILQEKTVTPTTSQQSIKPDSGYEGLSKVTVNAIPSQYIIPAGELEITENDTYDVTDKASVKVNVPSTGGYQMSLSDDGTELNFVWGGAKKEISFTVGDNSYQAEEGMTWAEWVESSYNTAGFYILPDDFRFVRVAGYYINYQRSTCTGSHSIISNGVYTLSTTITGGAN